MCLKGIIVKASWLLVQPFIRKVKGMKNIPKKGPYVFVANHSSYMDHLLLYPLFYLNVKSTVRMIAKKEHFKGYLSRVFHEYFDNIPIDRTKGKEALDKALSYLREGDVVGIYPEGTRTLTGKMQKGKTGAIRLALQAQVPIVPVGITSTFKILPKGKIIPNRGKASINIGKQLEFSRYYNKKPSKELYRKLTDKMMEKVSELVNR